MKYYYLIFIIIYISSLVICNDLILEDCTKNNEYLKITLYNNGMINKECYGSFTNTSQEQMSIYSQNKLIIYESGYNSENYCVYGVSSLDCKEFKKRNKESYCCSIKESFNEKKNQTCIEINKQEFERFRGIKGDLNTPDTYLLNCKAKIYSLNMFILVLILFVL